MGSLPTTVNVHPGDSAIKVTSENYRDVVWLAGACWVRLESPGCDVLLHGMRPEQIIALGEQIAIAGKKLLDEQKLAVIRAQLAEPVPDPFLPVPANGQA